MVRFILFFFTSLLSFCMIAQSQCDLKKDKDGIQVYTCKSDTSKFRSLKAEFIIENKSIEELQAFLFDVSKYLDWQYNVFESVLVKKMSDTSFIYRIAIDAPWPVTNRELIVLFSAVVKDENNANFYINTIKTDYPKSDDLVRVPFSQSSWTVLRVSGSLHVVYKMNIDPGGYVPPFLVNMAMADGPYQSFKKLKEMMGSEEMRK